MRGSAICQWVGADNSFALNKTGITIDSPLTYVCTSRDAHLATPETFSADYSIRIESAIDYSLPFRIVKPSIAEKARQKRERETQANFHPFSYVNLTPEERGIYLQWLAGGRQDQMPLPSLYWLYLAGIEWRCFALQTALTLHLAYGAFKIKPIHQVVGDDLESILETTHRVGRQVTDAACRAAYRRLHDAVVTSCGQRIMIGKPIPKRWKPFAPLHEEFQLLLAQLAYREGYLEADQVALLASSQCRKWLDDEITRQIPKYNELWLALWREAHTSPILITGSGEPAYEVYHPVSVPDLSAYCEIMEAEKYVITSDICQYLKDVSLRVFRALKPYARAILDREPVEPSLTLLPPILWDASKRTGFDRLCDRVLKEDGAVFTAQTLAAEVAAPVEHILSSLRHGDLLIGFQEHDILWPNRTNLSKIGPDTPFVLYPKTYWLISDFHQRLYKILGAAAWLDGTPSPEKQARFMSGIEELNEFLDSEDFYDSEIDSCDSTNWRAEALLCCAKKIRINSAVAGERWLYANRDEDIADFISVFLCDEGLEIILANGVTPEAIRHAKSFYAALRYSESQLEYDLAHRKVEIAPLDHDKVRRLRDESTRASKLLSGIFTGDEPGQWLDRPTEASEDSVNGLDAAHRQLLSELRERLEWPREAVAALCSRLGLMLEGALEHINEAVLDRLGEPLIEGDDPLEVNLQVAKQYLGND